MDFAAMIAAAAATASEEAGPPAPPPQQQQQQEVQHQHQQHSFAPQEPLPSVEGYQGEGFGGGGEVAAEISNGFSADPHLYMRILSLPILESLVGFAPCARMQWRGFLECGGWMS